MPATSWGVAVAAFVAGATWMESNTRMVNDGEGYWDRIDPTIEEIRAAAGLFATLAQKAGKLP